MTADLLLAIDQGTSATKALLLDGTGQVIGSGSAPLGQSTPRPGWVEQSPTAILDSVRGAVSDCFASPDGADLATRVVAVGMSTQRESVVLWERATGRPVAPMLSWQDQRTAERAARIGQGGVAALIRRASGLPLDPMFSALKANWLLDEYDPDRARSRDGELCLGTVDAWLIARCCGGDRIEVGNASRTQLLNLRTVDWDLQLLEIFDIPRQALPEIASSIGPFGRLGADLAPVPPGTPVTGVLGDSHAALYAHAGWQPGYVKATYGTGSSVMAGIENPDAATALGDELGLTIGWNDGTTGGPRYAVEGNVRASGATLAWLSELVGSSPADLAAMAAHASSDGVVIVPAFTGLGAPYWDPQAVGLITGLTLGTRLPQLARAALESIAFQVDAVVRAAAGATGPIQALLVDGGPTQNAVLMQLQADMSGIVVRRPDTGNLSALGVAHLAGLGIGMWTREVLEQLPRPGDEYRPAAGAETDAQARRRDWADAVARSRHRAAVPAGGTGEPG